MYPWRHVVIFALCLAPLAMQPTDCEPPRRTNLAVWGGKPSLGELSVDTEDCRTALQADCLGRLLRRAGAKAAKCPDIEESRVCTDIPCLSHTCLISTNINWGILNLFRPGVGYPKYQCCVTRWIMDIPDLFRPHMGQYPRSPGPGISQKRKRYTRTCIWYIHGITCNNAKISQLYLKALVYTRDIYGICSNTKTYQ